jgi:hypothetical protein
VNLLAELKRRNVIRMAGLYLVGAWLVVQVTSTVLPAESIATQTARRMDRLLLVVMALALSYFALDKFVLAPGRSVVDAPASEAAALARLQSILDAHPRVVPGIVPWALITLGEPEEGLRVVATFPTASNVWHAALWSPPGKAARAGSLRRPQLGIDQREGAFGGGDLVEETDGDHAGKTGSAREHVQ